MNDHPALTLIVGILVALGVWAVVGTAAWFTFKGVSWLYYRMRSAQIELDHLDQESRRAGRRTRG